MNTTIKFKHLLYATGVLLFLMAVGYTFNSISEESFWIGKTRLWSDDDSSYLKISRKVSRNAGAQLFDFNQAHFNWTGANGLELDNPLGDSIHGNKFAVYKDTSFSENNYYKWWVLKKQYFNDYDSLSLKWMYRNTLYFSTYVDSFWAINKSYKLTEKYTDVDLGSDYTDILSGSTIEVPHYGRWRIIVEYDYEFSPGVNTSGDAYDSIYVRLKHLPSGEFPPDTAIAIHKLAYAGSVYSGAMNRGIIILDKNVWQTEREFKVHGLASFNATDGLLPFARKITYIKITALLVN